MSKRTAKDGDRFTPAPHGELVPERALPRDALACAIVLGVLAVLAAALLWWPVCRMWLYESINYNEGWNAYAQQTAARGGKIYGERPRLSYTNYPPVSFYVIGLLGRATGDINMTGRWVSLLSLFAIAALSGMVVERLSGNRRAGVYSAVAFLVYVTMLKPDRVGMNDPHLFGMALGMAGVYCAASRPESNAWLRASGVVFALSLFVKHTLLAFPAAVAIFLFLHHRRRLMGWLIAAAITSAALLVFSFAAGGRYFLEHLGMPRAYSIINLGVELSLYVVLCNPAIAAVTVWAIAKRKEAGSGLVLWMFGLATAAGCIYMTGAGAEANLMFESVAALCMCLGLLAAWTTEWAKRTQRPNAALAAAALAPFLAAIYPTLATSTANVATFHIRRPLSEDFRRLVEFVRAQPGPALCENLLACFEAGKPKVYDPYVVTNLIATGKIREADVIALVDQRRFGVVVLERPGANAPVQATGHLRFSPEFMTHVLANYREVFGVSLYGVFVPR